MNYDKRAQKVENKIIKKGFNPERFAGGEEEEYYWALDLAANKLFYSDLDAAILTVKTIKLERLHSYSIKSDNTSVTFRFYGIAPNATLKCYRFGIIRETLDRVIETNKARYCKGAIVAGDSIDED